MNAPISTTPIRVVGGDPATTERSVLELLPPVAATARRPLLQRIRTSPFAADVRANRVRLATCLAAAVTLAYSTRGLGELLLELSTGVTR